MIDITIAQNDMKVSASGDAGFICAVKPAQDGTTIMAEHNMGGQWNAVTVCLTIQALFDSVSTLEDGQALFLHGFNMFFSELQRKFGTESGELRVVMVPNGETDVQNNAQNNEQNKE